MNQINEKNLWKHSNIGRRDMDQFPIFPDKEVIDDLPENDLPRGHVTPPRKMTLEVIDENEDKLDDSFYQIFWVII